ncbi:MAG: hypothetical protein Q7J48_15505 [Nocardioides sp.]|nr:hypothetical protein [Nocardioides sp.]
MTTEKLRDLLHEQVSDVTMTDLSVTAWRAGQRIRRRRSLAVVGGTAAAALAVTAGVSVLGDDPGRSPAGPAPSTPTPTPEPTPEPTPTASVPDARYAGVPLWVAPRVAEEAALPVLQGTGLPSEIDLSPGARSAAGIGRAVGVLGVWPDGDLSRVIAVGADGGSYSVPTDGVLERVADEQGNAISALTSEGLSPRGRRVFFVQERSLEVYDFQSGERTSIATPQWLAEGARWITDTEIWVPERLGQTGSGTSYYVDGGDPVVSMVRWLGMSWPGSDSSEAFGPLKSTSDGLAQSHFLSDGADAVVAVVADKPSVLGFDGLDERWKGCCPVVGWSDAGTVLFESRSADARVLAWRVGSHDVRQVSTIVGWAAGQESYVASWSVPLS